MKVIYTAPCGIVIENEIAKLKDAFEFAARVQELFTQEECGCCHSKRIAPSVREVDEYKFYEWRCLDCTAAFSFGQHKQGGTLFPKTWDKERGQPLPDKGWAVWTAQQQAEGYGSDNQRRPYTPQGGQGRGPGQNTGRPGRHREPGDEPSDTYIPSEW